MYRAYSNKHPPNKNVNTRYELEQCSFFFVLLIENKLSENVAEKGDYLISAQPRVSTQPDDQES